MSTDSLHFFTEAKLAQTARFIEASNAALARLLAMGRALPLDAPLLLEFAAMAESSSQLRLQLLEDLQPVLAETGPLAGISADPAARRLIDATQRVVERLDEMIRRINDLQQPGANAHLPRTS
jgi:hypothetical protein